MPEFRLTQLAESDLQKIDAYTTGRWGAVQADLYLEQLRSLLALLARTPGMGRAATQKRPALRRMEHGSHVIVYRETKNGILVTRVLHRRMMLEARTVHDRI